MRDLTFRKEWVIFKILSYDSLTNKFLFLCDSVMLETFKDLYGIARLNKNPPTSFFQNSQEFRETSPIEQLGYFNKNRIHFLKQNLMTQEKIQTIHLEEPSRSEISCSFSAEILEYQTTIVYDMANFKREALDWGKNHEF